MDPIANMLTQISNANHKFKETLDMPASKIKTEIARVLKEEGYISNYRVSQDKHVNTIRVTMKYSPQKERVIQGVKRVSSPGLRVYRKWTEIPSIQNGLGTVILSTSKGILSGQKAKEKKLGGEVLCYIW
ncbi:MAG: 30S ribosomal protein S8 [Elusimicrobia bacterium]|nr:30S ribosomal protein S8 [Elusimicrobiota bacterium]